MTTSTNVTATPASERQIKDRVRATLQQLEDQSLVGKVWELFHNTTNIAVIASRVVTVVAVTEGAVLSETYAKSRLDSLDSSKPKSDVGSKFFGD